MEHSKLVPRAFFLTSVGREKCGKMIKCTKKTQRNKQEKYKKIYHKAKKLDFQQISFLEVDVAVGFFDVEIYSAWITLFSILCYLNQGTNQITEPIGLVRKGLYLSLIHSFQKKSALG